MGTAGGRFNEGSELIMGIFRNRQIVEEAAIELAAQIYERATGTAEANELFTRAVHTLHTHVCIGMQTYKFHQRAEAQRQLEEDRMVKERNEKLTAQLVDLGIDPGPIFSDRQDGAEG